MTYAVQWHRVPEELQDRRQWLLASPNDVGELKVPTSVTFAGHVCDGSSTDPATWLSFHFACELAAERGWGIGYCLAADDPYFCVDLDVKNATNAPGKPELWTDAAKLSAYAGIIEEFDTYAELSQSGQGVHIWGRGKIGPGVKRAGVELYSQERFMVCTGRIIVDKAIEERHDLANEYAAQMRAAGAAGSTASVSLDGVDAVEDDAVLWERARAAANADKFISLCGGDWVALGYPSQSEADLSLMSMFTFYSRNDEQCRRMFRQTGLGQRDKANKNDKYLDYTLKRIRKRQALEDRVAEVAEAQGKAFLAREQAKLDEANRAAMAAAFVAADRAHINGAANGYANGHANGASGPVAGLELGTGGTGSPAAAPPPVGGFTGASLPPAGEGMQWPPGLAGAIAGFVYTCAPRPVKEIAIATALGWLAGVCGKSWIIPGSGLNMYIILVARSGVGKEAMHSGISALVSKVREAIPSAQNYVNFTDFASGPALAKACAEQSSFVNVAGEFGKKLKRMANSDHDGPMNSLRTVMTNLYQKSGPTSIVGGISYSKKENDVASISGVAYSMIGETTPDTLYASLTESMMEDGFLSRFTIIEYDGLRPQLNGNPNLVPDNVLAERCQQLVHDSTHAMVNKQRIHVHRTNEAGAVMHAFDLECDAQINSTTDESWRQMWNRAHLKMCRIAALLAVADNHLQPVISLPYVEWALDVVRRDIDVMRKRITGGDIGQGDNSREKKVISVLHDYLTKPVPASYGIDSSMPGKGIVPRKYIQTRVYASSAFSNAKQGSKRALDDAISSLVDSGYLFEMDKLKLMNDYGYQGRCFRIVQLPKSN